MNHLSIELLIGGVSFIFGLFLGHNPLNISTEVTKRDRQREILGLKDSLSPAPWRFNRILGRVTAPSALVLDLSEPGPIHAELGLTPKFESPDGMLVCDSVSREDGPLIAAAPDLLRALDAWQRYDQGEDSSSLNEIRMEINDALRRAKGEDAGSPPS